MLVDGIAKFFRADIRGISRPGREGIIHRPIFRGIPQHPGLILRIVFHLFPSLFGNGPELHIAPVGSIKGNTVHQRGEKCFVFLHRHIFPGNIHRAVFFKDFFPGPHLPLHMGFIFRMSSYVVCHRTICGFSCVHGGRCFCGGLRLSDRICKSCPVGSFLRLFFDIVCSIICIFCIADRSDTHFKFPPI